MQPNTRVVITDLDIPFVSIVWFMVKWAFAAIPAVIIVSLVLAVVFTLFAGFFAGFLRAAGG